MSLDQSYEYTEEFLHEFSSKSSVSTEAPFDAAVAEINGPSEPEMGHTWNGDINYAKLTTDQRDVASAILAFTQKLVMSVKIAVGSGSKRLAQNALPLDPVENYSSRICDRITKTISEIIDRIKMLTPKEQAIYINLLFVTMFRERAIVSGSRSSIGKGNRSFSYLIFRCLHKEMPETAINCIPLFIHFGYWGDLNALCAYYIKDGNDKRVVNKCINLMLESLDKSVRTLPGSDGKGFLEKSGETFTHSEFRTFLDTTRLAVNAATDDEIKSTYASVFNDQCAKYIPGEKKRHEHLRPLLIAGMLWKGDLSRALSAANFGQATLNRLTTILRRIGGVVESKMSANQWSSIDPSKVPAGALNKYRKAFLNEDMDESPNLYQTDGNRTDNPDRIELRRKFLSAATEGLVKGAGLDSVKFSRILEKRNITGAEANLVHSQFMALVEDLRTQLQTEYDESVAKWVEEGSDPSQKPLNPFNVIATIDVSGSMDSYNVMGPAIVLGIITTILSNLGNSFLTFHETPTLITLDMREGTTIVDWYKQVRTSSWGGSTNIDKAMLHLLELFKIVRSRDSSFDGRVNHIIFTDGQFNPNFARFNGSTEYQRYDTHYTGTDFSEKWNPFAKRMEILFHDNGFALPLTCFWSMNANSPGFPAHSKYTGLTLAEGLSHGLFVNVLGNKVTFKVNADGSVVADTDPLKSFLQGLARPDFDPVVETVLSTGEGVFSDESNHSHVKAFLAAYTK